ncbi:hypothetical protein [Sphingomonas sp. MMS24-J13]|uniref:hypothetical protein n=1 Tax=Sphingomonas sp. MMS24-J13 TaxID=3238686 RepID=UPI00384DA8BE
MRKIILLAGAASFACAAVAAPPSDPIKPAPTAAEWAALARLPDWSGTWSPDVTDQNAQIKTNPVPWKPEIQKQVDHWVAEEQAGRPKGLLLDCLPHGMPSLILISHNAMEILFTPGRVTLLGESDGNRLLRIWTDGRPHSPDPDPSFHGETIGHWEGDALVTDTIAILPQVYLAVSEAVGIPNNGDMHITQRVHLTAPDTLAFDLTIDAPKILTRPWTTRRLYYRKRQRSHEIVEGVCRQGDFRDATDPWGNAIFEPAFQQNGNILPTPGK